MVDRLLRHSVGSQADDLSGPELKRFLLQLPLWQDQVRGAPNEILRSALFLPSNRNVPRAYQRDAEIALIGDGSLRYTGEELRQDDEPVWLQLLHLCRGKPLGSPVEFPPAAFLRAVRRCHNRNPSSKDYKWLADTITRFTATAVVIQSSRLKKKVGLSMVRRFLFQDELGSRLSRWQVWIEPEMAELFGGLYYTQIEWEMRLVLPSGLTTWLMGFFSTHRKPFPVRLETLMATISRHNPEKNRRARTDFKRDITRALNELVSVGFLTAFEIDKEGLVTVKRG